uniref:Microfibril associated protein 5 n=1 Tax=Varanus komodoensis TaxID=61221 RepID=A0A8D2IUS0_VARKO
MQNRGSGQELGPSLSLHYMCNLSASLAKQDDNIHAFHSPNSVEGTGGWTRWPSGLFQLYYWMILCSYLIPECHEEQFPCTRLYSVHKPVKQCISYLCVTSVRRTYMINKEICSRIVCKEDEAMQDEICRQLAGLPPRRLRRSGQPQRPLCRQAKDQQRNVIDPQ